MDIERGAPQARRSEMISPQAGFGLLGTALVWLVCGLGQYAAADPSWTSGSYIAIPPFIAQSTDKPNVIVSLDTSGSMKIPAYDQPGKKWNTDIHDNFDPTARYYGYFDTEKYYVYDPDPAKLFFVEDSSSVKTATNWDGNFLNWLSMRRFDVVRKVLIGGKVRNRTPEPIGGEYWYVLLGQHEPEDRQFYKAYANSQAYTPSIYPDGAVFKMADGKIIPTSGVSGTSVQTTVLQSISGKGVEMGRVTMNWTVDDSGNDTSTWVYVPFQNSYSTPPAVVAKPATYNGGDPMVVRIRNITSSGFEIRPQEWDYKDGGHTTEQLFYVAADKGNYQVNLAAGDKIDVDAGGVAGFDRMCHNGAATISFGTGFSTFPVVFSGIASFADATAVTTRNESVSSTGFGTCMQEQESNGGAQHGDETLNYVALARASGSLPLSGVTVSTGALVEIGDSGGSNIDDSWDTIDFDASFGDPPAVVMDMQTLNGSDPAVLRVANNTWTGDQIDVKVEEERSADHERGHADEKVGYIAVSGPPSYQIQIGIRETDTTDKPNEPKGLLQALDGQMRLGLAVFNYDHSKSPTSIYKTSGKNFDGGTFSPCYPDVSKPVSDRTNWDICKQTQVGAPLSDLIDVIEDHPLIWATTPIAETMYDIGQYVAQQNHPTGIDLNSAPWPHDEARQGHPTASSNPSVLSANNDGVTVHPNAGAHPPFLVNNTWDPYYYSSANSTLPCGKVFVLNFNDGAPYTDWDAANGFPVPADFVSDGNGPSGEDEALDDVALMLRQDMRDDLVGHQEIVSYYVLAALGADPADIGTSPRRRLMEAAVNGGFVDKDNNHLPDVAHPADLVSYISSHDDNADLSDGGNCLSLKNEWDEDGDCVPDAFYFANDGFKLEQQLLAAFQSILKRVASGGAASVLAGSTGGEGAVYQARFQQEQTDGSLTTHWTGDVTAMLIDDAGRLRADTNGNDALDTDPQTDEIIDMCYDDVNQVVRVALSDSEASRPTATQTASCSQTTFNKDLFTIDYLWSAGGWLAGLSNAEVASQRTYGGLSGRYILTGIDGSDGTTRDDIISSSEQEDFVAAQFSGKEGLLKATTSQEVSDIVAFTRGDSSVTGSGYRSRQVTVGASEVTWRLGDIIYSSPVTVAAPAEDFDLIYGGTSLGASYNAFHIQYGDRRTVVYVGANDGMLHAFNGGFYDKANKAYLPGKTATTQYALGTELWAYLPYNLQPHMKYLADPGYGTNDGDHLYMVDFEPRVFDARIFNDSTTSTTGGVDGQAGVSHPHGWGTILIGSMRFGGGPIDVDIDNDGTVDDTFSNAVFILDVTDPEAPPRLLVEYRAPTLGFNLSTPTPILKNVAGVDQWYLLLGSGPYNAAQPSTALREGESAQSIVLMMLDLRTMALASDFGTDGVMTLAGADDAPDGFVTGMLPVDYDLDTQTDAVYISTANGTAGSYGGKLYRMALRSADSTGINSGAYKDVSAWSADIFLDDVGPITAIPNAAVDISGNRWVYVGTGRFVVRDDAADATQQAYYGLKEPRNSSGGFTWGAIDKSSLVDVSGITVNTNGVLSQGVPTLTNLSPSTATTFGGLQAAMMAVEGSARHPSGTVTANHGWFREFGQSPRTIFERNVGQAAIFGGVLSFTTFEPSGDVCKYEGRSNLYAVDFTTGTASNLAPVFGEVDTSSGPVVIDDVVDLGEGLVKTVSLHTGRGYLNGKAGSAIAQSSTAQTTLTRQQNFGSINSGENNWRTQY